MEISRKQIIKSLNLEPHLVGSNYQEVIRMDENFNKNNVSTRYKSSHNLFTSNFFLIDNNNPSNFHKLMSDEFKFLLLGDSLKLHLINIYGNLVTIKIGRDITKYDLLHFKIPGNIWVAAETCGDFLLISYVVVPRFEFYDFELAKKNIINEYSKLSKNIKRFTND